MRTIQLLLPAILSFGTILAAIPDTAEAVPRGRSHHQNSQYRPGNRAKQNRAVPELSVGAAAAALGLLGGGIMVITGRRRQKRG